MNRDDIIRMAEENGITIVGEAMFKFAALVAAAEREECAKVCDEYEGSWHTYRTIAYDCAAAIRARGTQ